MAEYERQQLIIDSDGCPLAATVYIPAGDPPFPAIAFSGPLASVRDQVVGRYAERLAAEGFLSLTFDHRNYGQSGGSRRQHEDPQGKLWDLRAAVTALERLPEVDPRRITLCGLALGGGYALLAASTDPRVSAVTTVAGAFNSPVRTDQRLGREDYRAVLSQFLRAAHRSDGSPAYLPVVSSDSGPAILAGEEQYLYFGTPRGRSPQWRNQITAASAYNLLVLDTTCAADLIAPTPVLLVQGRNDAYCRPEVAQEVHDRISGPKRLFWVDTERHTDLYDSEPAVSQAVGAIRNFLQDGLVAHQDR